MFQQSPYHQNLTRRKDGRFISETLTMVLLTKGSSELVLSPVVRLVSVFLSIRPSVCL